MRARRVLRDLYAPPPLTPVNLSAPLLVLPDDIAAEGAGLPGAFGLRDVPRAVRGWAGLGLGGVKVFAYGHDRDGRGTGALLPGNRMVAAIAEVKGAAPELAVTSEVCGCAWTDSGECVLRRADGEIDLAATYGLMAAMAVRHAEAGADAVSPTAMLNGAVRAVRAALDETGHHDVGVNPNIAIHTVLYGTFKALMATDPVAGHRRGLQLEPGRADRDALRQARRWVAEGADSLTLQPVMTAMDVLAALRADQDVPLVAYSTSGEFGALRELGAAGIAEYHEALRRAGADHILGFGAELHARRLAAPGR
ncbi:hypothetical protein [Actinocorallia sp. A-T 12471]|uniref:hypothetical protein n=1 Tax=Actinocorallia sp. A-T 12471 TaxID=3089813 RepID=UPI0029D0468C|nr:hypothetical protein [Actinocorallia sp. A-T 12471]MDX6744815.1 hypothetical protein [Actinocorallia sp. A-T 12471]